MQDKRLIWRAHLGHSDLRDIAQRIGDLIADGDLGDRRRWGVIGNRIASVPLGHTSLYVVIRNGCIANNSFENMGGALVLNTSRASQLGGTQTCENLSITGNTFYRLKSRKPQEPAGRMADFVASLPPRAQNMCPARKGLKRPCSDPDHILILPRTLSELPDVRFPGVFSS